MQHKSIESSQGISGRSSGADCHQRLVRHCHFCQYILMAGVPKGLSGCFGWLVPTAVGIPTYPDGRAIAWKGQRASRISPETSVDHFPFDLQMFLHVFSASVGNSSGGSGLWGRGAWGPLISTNYTLSTRHHFRQNVL